MTVADAAKEKLASKQGGNLPAKTPPKTLAGFKSGDVSTLLSAYKLQIAQAIPKHLTAERVIQLATTVIARNQEIKACTPQSVIGAVMNAAMLGLDITPQFGQAYFVPRNNSKINAKECTFMVGYRGWVQLFRRSGEISTIYAEVVREGDEFTVEYGLENNLVHKPNLTKRGKLIAVYAVVKYKDGGYNFSVLTEADVLARKRRSQAVQNGKSSPWDTDPEAMWKKSAIRSLIPYVPASVEMLKAAVTDGAVINSDMFSQETKDLDLDKIENAEETEAEDVTGQDKEDPKPQPQQEKKERPQDAKDEFLSMARPLMTTIIKARGSDYFARVLATVGYNDLESVPLNMQSRMIDALQYEVDHINK